MPAVSQSGRQSWSYEDVAFAEKLPKTKGPANFNFVSVRNDSWSSTLA